LAMKNNSALSQFHGDVRLEFTITSNGRLKDLEVFETRHVTHPDQKMLIAEVLKKGAYTPLPRELGTEKKIRLAIRL